MDEELPVAPSTPQSQEKARTPARRKKPARDKWHEGMRYLRAHWPAAAMAAGATAVTTVPATWAVATYSTDQHVQFLQEQLRNAEAKSAPSESSRDKEEVKPAPTAATDTSGTVAAQHKCVATPVTPKDGANVGDEFEVVLTLEAEPALDKRAFYLVETTIKQDEPERWFKARLTRRAGTITGKAKHLGSDSGQDRVLTVLALDDEGKSLIEDSTIEGPRSGNWRVSRVVEQHLVECASFTVRQTEKVTNNKAGK